MNELTIVNSMLALTGETPVESLYEDHGMVPTARDILDEADRDIQAASWWFNTEDATLTPDGSGYIVLATDVTGVTAKAPHRQFTQRGNRLYDARSGSYTMTGPVDVTLRRRVPLEDLPHEALSAIAAQARALFSSRHGNAQDTGPAREAMARMVALRTRDIQEAKAMPLQALGWRLRNSFRRLA